MTTIQPTIHNSDTYEDEDEISLDLRGSVREIQPTPFRGISHDEFDVMHNRITAVREFISLQPAGSRLSGRDFVYQSALHALTSELPEPSVSKCKRFNLKCRLRKFIARILPRLIAEGDIAVDGETVVFHQTSSLAA